MLSINVAHRLFLYYYRHEIVVVRRSLFFYKLRLSHLVVVVDSSVFNECVHDTPFLHMLQHAQPERHLPNSKDEKLRPQ